MFSNEQLTLFFLDKEKPNGKPMRSQQGPFCLMYALLRILDFHHLHPKYYPGNYPKNFMIAFDSFKQARKAWKQLPMPKDQYHHGKDFFNLIQKDNWDNIEMRDDILKYISSSSPHQKPKNQWKDSDYVNYFLYSFGFQLYFDNFQYFSAEKIQQILLQYGPLYICGDFARSNYDKINCVTTNDKKIHFVASFDEQKGNMYEENPNAGHAIVICGIDIATQTIFYLDSNLPIVIFQVLLETFFSRLNDLSFVYYRPCGKDDKYLENIIHAEEWNDKHPFTKEDGWPMPKNTPCHHIHENLSLGKIVRDKSQIEVSQLFKVYLKFLTKETNLQKENSILPYASTSTPTLFKRSASNEEQYQPVYKCQRRV